MRKRDSLTVRFLNLFEGHAEGPWAIAALLGFGFMIGRALGWI